jgi:hypothetical protein
VKKPGSKIWRNLVDGITKEGSRSGVYEDLAALFEQGDYFLVFSRARYDHGSGELIPVQGAVNNTEEGVLENIELFSGMQSQLRIVMREVHPAFPLESLLKHSVQRCQSRHNVLDYGIEIQRFCVLIYGENIVSRGHDIYLLTHNDDSEDLAGVSKVFSVNAIVSLRRNNFSMVA